MTRAGYAHLANVIDVVTMISPATDSVATRIATSLRRAEALRSEIRALVNLSGAASVRQQLTDAMAAIDKASISLASAEHVL